MVSCFARKPVSPTARYRHLPVSHGRGRAHAPGQLPARIHKERRSRMRQVLYALRFTGQAEPVGTVGNVLRAATSAPSSTLTSRVGTDGLTTTLVPAPGTEATFASEVTFTGETRFLEIGTMTFGAGHVLQFATIGSGYLAPSADLTRKHGTVMWRVEGGEGQFAESSGLITSNFFVDEAF